MLVKIAGTGQWVKDTYNESGLSGTIPAIEGEAGAYYQPAAYYDPETWVSGVFYNYGYEPEGSVATYGQQVAVEEGGILLPATENRAAVVEGQEAPPAYYETPEMAAYATGTQKAVAVEGEPFGIEPQIYSAGIPLGAIATGLFDAAAAGWAAWQTAESLMPETTEGGQQMTTALTTRVNDQIQGVVERRRGYIRYGKNPPYVAGVPLVGIQILGFGEKEPHPDYVVKAWLNGNIASANAQYYLLTNGWVAVYSRVSSMWSAYKPSKPLAVIGKHPRVDDLLKVTKKLNKLWGGVGHVMRRKGYSTGYVGMARPYRRRRPRRYRMTRDYY